MRRYRVALVYSSSVAGKLFVARSVGDVDAVSRAAAVARAKVDLPKFLCAEMRAGRMPCGELGSFCWLSVEVQELGRGVNGG